MKSVLLTGLAVGTLLACGNKPQSDATDTGTGDRSTTDQDGDGVMADVDCDDSDATTFPGAEELCDGLDNDCDGEVEEQFEVFVDSDGDAYGDDATAFFDCELLAGHVTTGGDCDDTDAGVNPGGVEVCDGVDNDCDPVTSEEGIVTRTDSSGAVSDVSDWFSGSANSPSQVTVDGVGDTLFFCDGTYFANITITASDVTLEGRVGQSDTTVLDGAQSDTVVTVRGDGLLTTLSDLTVQNGSATSNPLYDGVRLGGGIQCFGFSELQQGSEPEGSYADIHLVGVTVQNNDAQYGGGLLTQQCHATLTESLFRGNWADFSGAGVYLAEGDGFFTDVVVEEHLDAPAVSAVFHEGWDDSWNAVWEDVQVRNNTSLETAYNGKAIQLVDVDLVWYSNGATRSGLWNNTGNGSGHAMEIEGSMQATDVDFGEPGTANENDTVDFRHYGSQSDYAAGDASTFFCADHELGCGSAYSTSYGSWYQSGTASEGFFGHVIQVDERTTLREYELGFGNPNCSTRVPLLLQRSSVANGASQNWEVIWVGYTASMIQSKLLSDRVGQVLEPGEYYALAFAFDCGSSSGGVNVAPSGSSPVDLEFGTSAGSVSKFGTYAYPNVGDSISMSYTTDDDFNMTVELVGL